MTKKMRKAHSAVSIPIEGAGSNVSSTVFPHRAHVMTSVAESPATGKNIPKPSRPMVVVAKRAAPLNPVQQSQYKKLRFVPPEYQAELRNWVKDSSPMYRTPLRGTIAPLQQQSGTFNTSSAIGRTPPVDMMHRESAYSKAQSAQGATKMARKKKMEEGAGYAPSGASAEEILFGSLGGAPVKKGKMAKSSIRPTPPPPPGRRPPPIGGGDRPKIPGGGMVPMPSQSANGSGMSIPTSKPSMSTGRMGNGGMVKSAKSKMAKGNRLPPYVIDHPPNWRHPIDPRKPNPKTPLGVATTSPMATGMGRVGKMAKGAMPAVDYSGRGTVKPKNVPPIRVTKGDRFGGMDSQYGSGGRGGRGGPPHPIDPRKPPGGGMKFKIDPIERPKPTGSDVMNKPKPTGSPVIVGYPRNPGSSDGRYGGSGAGGSGNSPERAKKMAKADGQGAFINGKPAPQSHSLTKSASCPDCGGKMSKGMCKCMGKGMSKAMTPTNSAGRRGTSGGMYTSPVPTGTPSMTGGRRPPNNKEKQVWSGGAYSPTAPTNAAYKSMTKGARMCKCGSGMSKSMCKCGM